jgi:hypothetical protein
MTCTFFLRLASLCADSFSSSPMLLSSEGTAVVTVLRTSVDCPFDAGSRWFASSTSEKSEVTSGVHESRLSGVGLLERPEKAWEIDDFPDVNDVKFGFDRFRWLSILCCVWRGRRLCVSKKGLCMRFAGSTRRKRVPDGDGSRVLRAHLIRYVRLRVEERW